MRRGGIPLQRDRLCARKGFLRGRYVGQVTGVFRQTVKQWPVPYETIHASRFYSWDGVRKYLGPGACHALSLPETATEALERALGLIASGDIVVVQKWEECGHRNQLDPKLKCTKRFGHAGPHHQVDAHGDGPEWGPNPTTLRHLRIKRERYMTNKAIRLHDATDSPHVIEPDLPDTAFPGLPHVHPLSIYFGNAQKLTAEKIFYLYEYSRRIPSQAVIKGRPWRANRNIDNPHLLPEWWKGEYIEVEGQTTVKWSKIIERVSHPEILLPAPGKMDPTVTTADFEDVAKAKPPEPPPEPPIPLARIAPPAPGNLLYCNDPLCKHTVEWHDDRGCTFARGTIAACSCLQVAPPWALAQRKRKEEAELAEQSNG